MVEWRCAGWWRAMLAGVEAWVLVGQGVAQACVCVNAGQRR